MIRHILGWAVVALLLTGCAPLGEGTKTNSRAYLLHPVEVLTAQAPLVEDPPSLGVGRVVLPAYLDRPQIVHRGEGNRLLRGAFDVWGEPLGEGVSRVLGENLGRALPARHVVFSPWREAWAPELQLRVRILRFDGRMNGEVVLKGNYVAQDKTGQVLAQGSRTVTALVQGGGYPNLVEAMNQALNDFSLLLVRDLAEQIKRSPAN